MCEASACLKNIIWLEVLLRQRKEADDVFRAAPALIIIILLTIRKHTRFAVAAQINLVMLVS